MKHTITGAQDSTKNCFVCGVENVFGLKGRFYRTEQKEVIGIFTPKKEHQGYAGRLHGGISAALLDETLGRTIMNFEEKEAWGLTVDLQLKYRKAVPLEGELKVIARLDKKSSRFFESSGELFVDGQVAVSAKARYILLEPEKIDSGLTAEDNWVPNETLPEFIEI